LKLVISGSCNIYCFTGVSTYKNIDIPLISSFYGHSYLSDSTGFLVAARQLCQHLLTPKSPRGGTYNLFLISLLTLFITLSISSSTSLFVNLITFIEYLSISADRPSSYSLLELCISPSISTTSLAS